MTVPTGLDTAYPIEPAVTECFDAQGFVHLSGVLSPETIAEYEPTITSEVIRLNTQTCRSPSGHLRQGVPPGRTSGGRASRSRSFVLARRLARIAAELLGVHGVRLYHDQALYKEAGGGITPWHADQYYWPLSTDRAYAVDPAAGDPARDGPGRVRAAGATLRLGRDLPISDECEARLGRP